MAPSAASWMSTWRALAASLAVLLACVASGTLECQPTFENRKVAHGREVYGRMCAVCHGASGEGYKADQAPALANARFLASVSDAFLTDAITAGRTGSTMSSWGVAHGGPLAPADVEAVVEFLHTWQKGPRASLDERPLRGAPMRGAPLFERECASCHGKQGKGGSFVSVGNPTLLSDASNGFLRDAVRFGRPGTSMQGFAAKLGDDGVEDAVAYLRSLTVVPPAPGRSMFAPPARPPPIPLGPVPLNPRGPEPLGFVGTPGFTKAAVVEAQLRRGARMAILDARAPPDYAREHIAGAVSVPFYAPEAYVSELPKDAWLVCYCGCPHAESGQLAQKLRAKGFTKVTVIDEGLRYWHSKDYGTHSGLLP